MSPLTRRLLGAPVHLGFRTPRGLGKAIVHTNIHTEDRLQFPQKSKGLRGGAGGCRLATASAMTVTGTMTVTHGSGTAVTVTVSVTVTLTAVRSEHCAAYQGLYDGSAMHCQYSGSLLRVTVVGHCRVS